MNSDEPQEGNLDPADWREFRNIAHRALDDAIDSIENVRERKVWQPVPREVRDRLSEPFPEEGSDLDQTYDQFQDLIFPYPTGNIHPRFWGWVHGSGTLPGMLAEMLAAAMNSNCGGRDHSALYVERSVIEWCKRMFGFPDNASGVLVSGSSMANLIALTVARNVACQVDVRREGILKLERPLVAYASVEVHESAAKAMEILGLGNEALRRIAIDSRFRMDMNSLREQVATDRAAGLQPFCVIASAGTVNTGAIDCLESVADFCQSNGLWFHVDGAFGSLAVLSPKLKHLFKGLERADSLAFDFHKWMHVPYDCGCILIRKGEHHLQTFTMRPPYLQSVERGLAGGGTWFCEYGPELSRSFRALKVWFTLKHFGTRRLGQMIQQNCDQAEYLATLVRSHSNLELLVDPSLNVVCCRLYDPRLSDPALNQLNREIVADLHELGIAAPSTTTIHGRLVIRVAITNHRSTRRDFDFFVSQLLEVGMQRLASIDC